MALEKSCIDNLERCRASCCRSVFFNVGVFPGHPLELYYKARGFRIVRLDRKNIQVHIDHDCQQLTADYKCKLHDSGKKPSLCKTFNEKNAKSGLFDITEGCIYKD